MAAVADALEAAKEEIFITDWMYGILLEFTLQYY